MQGRLYRTALLLAVTLSAVPELAVGQNGTSQSITYWDGAQQIRVFTTGNSGHLVVDAWDGNGWTWFDLGLPLGLSWVLKPTAIRYVDAGGIEKIRVFDIGQNYNTLARGLFVDAWDGFGWT